ncbi:G protein pathway suppressor 2 [Trachymyrmex septentrionalis]|uniref:G protein pathway suppressor 2 n=1 Tax=Trachymyrmex septentrionalis TaxID=34720 RepID=A0A195F6T1_9HYME|nr:PREDICTED: G protein pathway suppressor 2 [Trachymyrmex septentrionalis]KYN36086.1 G protein pathway suppressor 2 [Trachymyrmex septentrionalis]
MPAILVGPPQRNEQMWQALKTHILRERQRKKQEQEADAEEERLRKERERQQKQDVMTLGETREQISNLDNELSQLKAEKHQLFLQLKKVLNEDDRRRQLIKETSVCSEVSTTVGGYPATGPRVVHPQLFLPLQRSSSPLYKVAVSTPTHLLQSGTIKRTHTPSPPPAASYHSAYGYKPPPSIPSYNPPPPKAEEARRSGDARAVLWNKNNQYSASNFYSAPTGQSVYSYSAPASQPSREPSESAKPVYLSSGRAPLATHQTAYVTNLHSMEHKGAYGEDKFYLRPTNHVTVHGGAIPIQQPPQGAKTGGITSGYPVRAPQPPPPSSYPPPPPPSPGTYVSGSAANVPGRLLYTQPGARYLQREI